MRNPHQKMLKKLILSTPPCSRILRNLNGRLPIRFCCFRLLKVVDRRVKLVAAPCVAEPNNIAVVLGQRVGLYRLAGPRAGLVDAISDVKIIRPAPAVNNRFLVVQIPVPSLSAI